MKDEGERRAEGFQETIARMRKAREEKEKVRKAWERGEPQAGSERRKGTETESSSIPATPGFTAKSSPPPQESHQKLNAAEIARKLEAIPKAEVMTLGINIRPGVTEDLTLYEGDDLFAVVSTFASKHGED